MSEFRDAIINELKARIYTISPDLRVIEGTGGFWGKWSRDLPVVHFFENAAVSTLEKPGLYKVDWDIQLEYVRRISNNGRNLYTEGRQFLAELQAAVEIDDSFTDRTTGNKLVYRYFKSADEIIEVSPSVVNTATIYNFLFFEEFGYNENVPNCKNS